MRKRIVVAFSVIASVVAIPPTILIGARKALPGTFIDELYFATFFATPFYSLRKTDIVVFGDSLVYRAPWRIMYPLSDIVNLGVVGETTRQMIGRVRQVEATKPRRLFLLAGVNDLGDGASPEALAQSYQALASKLSSHADKMYVSSILPSDVDGLRQNIPEANKHIEAVCRALPNCAFLDLYAGMEVGGKLSPGDSLDGVHLTLLGYYHIWRLLAKQPF
jgi:GDSL-like Lipase/Acylhydrolase family